MVRRSGITGRSKTVYHTPVPPQQRYLLSFIDLHFSRMRFRISQCRTIRLPLSQQDKFSYSTCTCFDDCVGLLPQNQHENMDAKFLLENGNRVMIKRKLFEEYLDKANVI